MLFSYKINIMSVLKDIQKGFKKVGKEIKKDINKINPFKNKNESLIKKERLKLLHDNIYLLLAQLKDTPKSIDELTIYIMRKGKHVDFSEAEVRSEIIKIKKAKED